MRFGDNNSHPTELVSVEARLSMHYVFLLGRSAKARFHRGMLEGDAGHHLKSEAAAGRARLLPNRVGLSGNSDCLLVGGDDQTPSNNMAR